MIYSQSHSRASQLISSPAGADLQRSRESEIERQRERERDSERRGGGEKEKRNAFCEVIDRELWKRVDFERTNA